MKRKYTKSIKELYDIGESYKNIFKDNHGNVVFGSIPNNAPINYSKYSKEMSRNKKGDGFVVAVPSKNDFYQDMYDILFPEQSQDAKFEALADVYPDIFNAHVWRWGGLNEHNKHRPEYKVWERIKSENVGVFYVGVNDISKRSNENSKTLYIKNASLSSLNKDVLWVDEYQSFKEGSENENDDNIVYNFDSSKLRNLMPSASSYEKPTLDLKFDKASIKNIIKRDEVVGSDAYTLKSSGCGKYTVVSMPYCPDTMFLKRKGKDDDNKKD